ncbi:hypothetical protein [Cellulomonas sp. URHE0023]|uniref:hypothetical protein n=1 Tax=Cellulomonas sp. URHE0023 TaxID=1380354 RepID=UPI000488E1B0|nr:hypothetical protein [Cellulomonas sp. URHE0023]
MAEELRDLLVGPAVIVDDEVNDTATEIGAIRAEIERQQIPVVAYVAIPDDNALRHWQVSSMIIVDWDLTGEERLPGVSTPSVLETGIAQFIKRLVDSVYAPVFIFTREDVELVWQILEAEFDAERAELQRRIEVRAKSAVIADVLAAVTDWWVKHPAMYALKAWDRSYAAARESTFREFEESSPSWPGALWAALEAEGSSPGPELADVIGRNVVNRLPSDLFNPAHLHTAMDLDGASLRRILHRQAVIDEVSLDGSTISPGDFFFEEVAGDRPPRILINVSPSCDTVARAGESLDDVRLLLLIAEPMAPEVLKRARKVHELYRAQKTTEAIIWHVDPLGWPYKVKFSSWNTLSWSEVKEMRRGRLLDPYATQLQEQLGQYLYRRGFMALPERAFEGLS